jgi:hypothetical protein
MPTNALSADYHPATAPFSGVPTKFLLSNPSQLSKMSSSTFVAQNVFCLKKVIKNGFVAKLCFSGNCFNITYPLFKDRKYLALADKPG